MHKIKPMNTTTIKVLIIIMCLSGISFSDYFNSSKANNHNTLTPSNKKRVLVLNAYHDGFHWTQRVMDGINSVLGSNHNTELFINYMDTKRVNDSVYYHLYKNLLEHKYKHTRFDAIISTDDNALDFLIKYKNELFGNVPVAFCGINDFQPHRLKGVNDFTGVYESYNVKEVIDLIKNIHSTTRNIVMISDNTVSGQAFINQVKRYENSPDCDINIQYLTNYSAADLAQQLAKIEDNSIIIWAIYLKLPNNITLTTSESLQLVMDNCALPIYCIWDVVGMGAVGGKITSPEYQGQKAAEITLRLLEGTKPEEIPIKGSPLIFKFDQIQLDKHGISNDLLPDESVIINHSFTLFQRHRKSIITIVVIMCFLVLTIVVLLYLIRKRKHAEKQLRASYEQLKRKDANLRQTNLQLISAKEEAEKSNKLKSIFLTNLSHEIRTPMNGILGFVELLKEDDQSQEVRQRYLSVIDTSAKRLLSIINELVDISKIEAGVVETASNRININQSLTDIYLFFAPLAKDKGLRFTLKKGLPNTDCNIVTDANKLEQILTNFVKNAIKFTNEGLVEMGYTINDNNILFYVKDTGIGIDESSKQIIFERFRKANTKTLTADDGIGLGLSISKSFALKMNGKIWLESEINKGSTFYFQMPMSTISDD